MGSPIAYESRKKELEKIWTEKYPNIPATISNNEITQSFIDLIDSSESIKSRKLNQKDNNIGLSEFVVNDNNLIELNTKTSTRSIDFHTNNNTEEINNNTNTDITTSVNIWNNDNYLLQYLKNCSIGVIIGDLLFIHGGLHSYNLG